LELFMRLDVMKLSASRLGCVPVQDLLQNFRVEVAEVAELEARLERPGQMWR